MASPLIGAGVQLAGILHSGQTGQALQPGLEAVQEYGVFGPAQAQNQALQAQAVFAPATAALSQPPDATDTAVSNFEQALLGGVSGASNGNSSVWEAVGIAVVAGLVVWAVTAKKGG